VERLVALIRDPVFLVGFPAVGLGVHSIPIAAWWALPWTSLILPAGAWLGMVTARRLPIGSGIDRRDFVWAAGATVMTLALANIPVLLTVPHEGSPRIFTPTWLILVVAFTLWAARVRWRRPAVLGLVGGTFAAGAVLSLLLSVSVRLASAEFMERSAQVIAARVSDGAMVAVCGVRRTVVTPAPRGSFAIHDLLYDWSARTALVYYTGRRVTFGLAGELWPHPCPDAADVDAILSFDELLAQARP
jgi:hypothetical protein